MDYRFDFDDQLPDLPMAFDLEAVSLLFETRWPGHADVAGQPKAVKALCIQDIKYKPSNRCVVTYELLIEQVDAPPWETIGVLEVLPSGTVHRIYDADPKLPWLKAASDPFHVQERISEMLAKEGLPSGVQLRQLTTVRYKPGLHCVFRYDVDTPMGAKVFYGKLFSEDGEEMLATIHALHEASLFNANMPRIPEPLAYWPEAQLLLQPEVSSGTELRSFAFDSRNDYAERVQWIRQAGVSLAALHATQVAGGSPRTFGDDLHGLSEYTAMMAKVNSDLETRFQKTVVNLVEKAQDLVEPTLVASHGAMRTDQFMIQDGGLVMIDLDSFCWSNPARDLGNFLAYMCWKAIRQPEHGEFVEEAGQAFLDGYLEGGGSIDNHWLAIYQAASLLKIAGRRFRSLTFLEWPLVPHLIDAAQAVIKDEFESPPPKPGGEDGHHRQILHLTTASSKTKYPAVFIDTEFPALWYALNAEMMSDRIRPLLSPIPSGVNKNGKGPGVRKVKLLAYKPGKRGVLRYDMDKDTCVQNCIVLGKLYPELYLAERAYEIMKVLSEEVFAGKDGLGIPRPLGIIKELSMLFFEPAEGQLLGEMITNHPWASAQTYQIMEKAAEWLATFHKYPMKLDKYFQVQNEIDNFHEWATLVSKSYPDEFKASWRIANYLIDEAGKLRFEMSFPIHKDFHHEHILVNGGLKVIDFDEIRLGDPNFDLAHFCANFYLLAYRNNSHPGQFARLQNRFLETYSRYTGWTLDERFIFFYTYSCLKLAKQICKKRGPRPWPEGDEQRAQVWLMLEQGLATMAQGVNDSLPLPVVDFTKDRKSVWNKAIRISKSATSSAAIRASHKLLS